MLAYPDVSFRTYPSIKLCSLDSLMRFMKQFTQKILVPTVCQESENEPRDLSLYFYSLYYNIKYSINTYQGSMLVYVTQWMLDSQKFSIRFG